MSARVVCITGAAGFLGSHLVREFLERGFTVRATVRDADQKVKNAHLWQQPGASERLRLFSADLGTPGSYREAVEGSDWVVHAAAAVRLGARNPEAEIITPTVEGTANVLEAVRQSSSVRRLGLVSSVAAVMMTERGRDHLYTEADWCTDATVSTNPYGLAKTKSERMVEEFCQTDTAPFLAIVNPAVVLGPILSRLHMNSSVSIVRDLYLNNLHGCPHLGIGVVDVRDVTTALFTAMDRMIPGRTILAAGSLWLQEVAETIRAAFPDSPASTRRLPNLAVYFSALFSKQRNLAFLRRTLGRKPEFSNARLVSELGIAPRPPDESIVDTCRSLLEMRAMGRRS